MKAIFLSGILLFAIACGAQEQKKKRVKVLQNDSAMIRKSPAIVVPPDTVHQPMPVIRADTAVDDSMPIAKPPKNIQHK